MAHKIFIGRNPSCDCCIPQTFGKVSNNHAEIEENNGRLFFVDHSSNGTLINGQWVFNTRVEIRDGDDIRLANSYSLSWSTIRQFFPEQLAMTRPMSQNSGGRKTQLYDSGDRPRPFDYQERAYARPDNRYERDGNDYGYQPQQKRGYQGYETKTWNWGAFLLGWIWAVGHSIVWPLFATLGAFLILILIPIIFPLVLAFTIPIYNILLFALAIYLGAKGSSMAWENGCFDSIEHFKTKERKWAIAGLIVWGIVILFIILSLCLWFSSIVSLFAFL